MNASKVSRSKKQASITPFNWVQQVAGDRQATFSPFFEIISFLGTCRGPSVPKTEAVGSTPARNARLRVYATSFLSLDSYTNNPTRGPRGNVNSSTGSSRQRVESVTHLSRRYPDSAISPRNGGPLT